MFVDKLPASLRSRLLSVGINPKGVLDLMPVARLEFLAELASRLEALIDAVNGLREWMDDSTAPPTSESICENGGPAKPSEMVERVVDALRALDLTATFEDFARAAIEAMREPTVEQARHMDSLLAEDTPAPRMWRWVWQELIDKALEGPK